MGDLAKRIPDVYPCFWYYQRLQKTCVVVIRASPRVREIFSTLQDTGTAEDFDTVHQKLTVYFEPQKNTRCEVYNFRQLEQAVDESLDAFYIPLRTAAANCEFGEKVKDEIEKQIIIGGSSSQIRRKALKNPNFK